MAMSPQEKQLWQQLAQADAAGDTETATRIAAQIDSVRRQPKQQSQPSQDQSGAMDSPVDKVVAFSNAAFDNATFGLGPMAVDWGVRNALSALSGGRVSADEIQANIEAKRNQRFQDNPIATGAGTVAGIAGNVAGLSAALPKAALMTAGKPVSNALKAAGWGGGTAGLTTLTHGGSPSDALVATGAGAIAGPVVGKGVEMVAARVAPAASRAWRLVADKLGVSADDLSNYIRQYKSLTGESPSVSQLMSAEQAGAIRQLAAQNPKMAAAMQTARRAQEQNLPSQVGNVVRKAAAPEAPLFLRTVDPAKRSPQSLYNALDASMDSAVAKIENEAVEIPVSLYVDQQFRQGVPRAMRKQFAQAYTDAAAAVKDVARSTGQSVDDLIGDETMTITLRQADTIRRKLRRLQNSDANLGEDFKELAEEITGIAGDAVPAYAKALEEYGKGARFIQGFRHSYGSGAAADTAADSSLRAALSSAEGTAGQKAGVLAYTANRAAKSPQSAAQVAEEISSNTSKATEFADATTAYGAKRAKESAGALVQGERSAAQATPSSVNPDVSAFSAGESAVVGAGEIAVGLPFSGVHKIINSLTSVLKSQRFPEAVQQEIAQALMSNDEKVVAATLAKLAKATGDMDAIKRLATVISAETGFKLGQILGPDEPATAR